MRPHVFSALVLGAAASLANAQSAAPNKPAIAGRMAALASEIDALRARGASAREVDARLCEYERLVAALGGGDPVAAARARSSATSGPAPRAATTTPPGSTATTTSFTSTPALAIPDVATVSDSILVTGAGTYLWDVDLTTTITHTWCGDLDMYLIAPSGKRVTIATDIAEGYADCFAGTLWDDAAPDSAFSYSHVDYVVSTPLDPEGKLHRLAGDDPNGTWTLEITDDAGADVGTLSSWTLDLTALTAPPVASLAPIQFSSTPALAIDGSAPHVDAIVASGLGANTSEVRVRLEISHAWSSDLEVDLISSTGKVVRLTTLNGSDLDDVFDGTDFFDVASQIAPAPNPARDQPIDEYPFVDLVAAIRANPEGSLTRLIGDDPNGTWTLQVVDTYPAADDGVLNGWSLSIATYISVPTPYCAPIGPTAGGCVPTIVGTQNPNVAHSSPCTITISDVDANRNGIVFYSAAGPHYGQWCGPGQGNSHLCASQPTQRTGGQDSGGGAGACDGTLFLDWNDYQSNHPGAQGTPWSAGDNAWVQGWFRSPSDCKTTFLSEALLLTYQP